MSDFRISDITDNAINSNGIKDAILLKAFANPNKGELRLDYDVESSVDDRRPVSSNGQFVTNNAHGYRVVLLFYNLQKIMQKDFLTQPYSQQKQILTDIFDNGDVRITCDCPAFYWQGMWEDDDKASNTVDAFSGTPGKGIWKNRHKAGGGDHKQGMCKHIYSQMTTIDIDLAKILKMLGSKVPGKVAQKQAGQTDKAKATALKNYRKPEQPKVNPKVQQPTTQEVNNAETEEVESRSEEAEAQGFETADTTNTEERKVDGGTLGDAAEGESDIEPPIEEPVKATDNEKAEEDAKNEELETVAENVLNRMFTKILKESRRRK